MDVSFHLLTESIQRKGTVFLFGIVVGKPCGFTVELLSLSSVKILPDSLFSIKIKKKKAEEKKQQVGDDKFDK